MDYDQIIDACTDEINGLASPVNELENENFSADFVLNGSKLLRSTFYILCKRQKDAMVDLNEIIEDPNTPISIK